MSSNQKAALPTLQGQRIKARKRDEKEKFDPGAFRDSLLSGLSAILHHQDSPSDVPAALEGLTLEEDPNGTATPLPPPQITQDHLDALYKFLDTQGGTGKIDYRKYGESLFDILIAGGILAPGGTILTDGDQTLKSSKTDLCVFSAHDIETIRAFAHVVVKLIRRYKYLEKTLTEEFLKIIKFLKGFTPEEREKLAKFTGVLLAGGLVPCNVLASALQDYFVKDGIAATFLIQVLQIWLADKDAITVWSNMKKAGLDQKIMDFFPASKRNAESLNATFMENGLASLLDFQKAGLGDRAKKELQIQVSELVKEEANVKEITAVVKDAVLKNNMHEHEVIVLLWNTVMRAVEWNKKEELVAEQALRHLKIYTPLFKAFSSTPQAELSLLVRVQDFCYENMNFLKVFQKVVVLFYKAEVLSEESILKWYTHGHSNKGKSVFLEQIKKFVEWLQNAEEESEEEA